MDSNIIGLIIKKYRKKHDMTQKELAYFLSVSDKVISKWETGGSMPDILMLTKMAEMFKCTVDDFLGNTNTQIMEQPKKSNTVLKLANINKFFNKKSLWIIIPFLIVAIILSIVLPLTIGKSIESTELTGIQIYEMVNPSVVYIRMTLEGGISAGSGIFINSTGRVVTNYHVIEDALNGKIYTSNGQEYDITYVVGYDVNLDIAIVDTTCLLSKPAKLADSSVETGSTVYAIGYPQSFIIGSSASTFTEGVISNSDMTFSGNNYYQTTVQITHGNSGGALVNSKGEIIGITSASLDIEDVDYMNLAIPIEKINIIDNNVNKTINEVSLDNKLFSVNFYTTSSTKYATQEIRNNGTAQRPSVNPARTNYTFRNWYKNPTCTELYDFSNPIIDSINIYAGWYSNPIIAFNPNEGTLTYSTIPYNTAVTKPSDPVNYGWEFVGWFTDDTLNTIFDFDSLITANITLFAGWHKKPIVSFNTNEGNTISDIMIDYNSVLEEPIAPIKEGYEFEGWYFDEELNNIYVFDTLLTENIVLFAKWNKKPIVSFITFGGTTIPQETISYATIISIPPQPIKNGFSFAGWFTDSSYCVPFDFDIQLTTDVSIYGKWEPIEILYESNSIEINSIETLLRITNSNEKYYLSQDIHIDNTFSTITEFNGVLDGNGHKIIGLSTPLIANNNGTIANLILSNVNLNMIISESIGALAKNNTGIITCCSSIGKIRGYNYSNHDVYVGGLVGTNYGAIINCYTNCEVKAESGKYPFPGGWARAGGITAINFNNIDNCYIMGTVYAYSYQKYIDVYTYKVAGKTVSQNSGNIFNCFSNTTQTTGLDNSYELNVDNPTNDWFINTLNWSFLWLTRAEIQ